MKKNRVISLLLSLTLLFALTVTVRAVSGPNVEYAKEAAMQQTVSLNNLSGDCYGVQLTLTLQPMPKELVVQFDEAITTRDWTSYTSKIGTSDVTLYVVSKAPLNFDNSLTLAELTAEESFTITACSGLKWLDKDYGGEIIPDNPSPSPSDNPSPSPSDNPSPSPSDNPSPSPSDNPSPSPSDNPSPSPSDNPSPSPSDNPSPTPTANPTPTPSNTPGSSTIQSGPTTVRRPDSGAASADTTPAPTASSAPNNDKDKDTDQNKEESTTPLPFTDVADDAWYYDVVSYAYTNGLMNGVSDTSFAPDGITTRAQIVTILYRLEGLPKAESCDFTDVPENQWYYDSVSWASANGIVNGYGNGTFGPNDPITREQMAAILYRYAGWKHYDVSDKADLSGYSDADSISPFALEPMSWANANGLITGVTTTTLVPGGTATRAQAATILTRFCQAFQT